MIYRERPPDGVGDGGPQGQWVADRPAGAGVVKHASAEDPTPELEFADRIIAGHRVATTVLDARRRSHGHLVVVGWWLPRRVRSKARYVPSRSSEGTSKF